MAVDFEIFLTQFESTLAENRRRLSFFSELSHELHGAGISALPLKGLDLLLRAYPSPGMRPMADIDLLIQKKDVRQVMIFFESRGFTRKLDEGLTYVKNEINLDIIWDFWYFHSPEQMEAVWARASSGALHAEDAFLYMTAYAAAHRGVLSETFVRDLDFFLQKHEGQIRWPELAKTILSLKLETPCFHALVYAAKRGLHQIPADFLSKLKPGRISLFFYRKLVTEDAQPKVSYLFTWLGYPSPRGKLKLLREKFFPSRFELEIQRGVTSLPGYAAWLITHPFILVWRAGLHAFQNAMLTPAGKKRK